jgi:phosphoribosylglycinamide formyltransferase-1
MSTPATGIVVLISGRGSNLESIIRAIQNKELDTRILAVISNRSDAGGLEFARAAGIPIEVIEDKRFTSRRAFDDKLIETIEKYEPKLVVLAGFMRILGETLVRHFLGRMINIHPALLPRFPGLHTHKRALEEGVDRHGATVHFVTPEVDAGPVIIQRSVPVLVDDDIESLAARVLEQEHIIYPMAIRWFVEDRLTIKDGVVLLDGKKSPQQTA